MLKWVFIFTVTSIHSIYNHQPPYARINCEYWGGDKSVSPHPVISWTGLLIVTGALCSNIDSEMSGFSHLFGGVYFSLPSEGVDSFDVCLKNRRFFNSSSVKLDAEPDSLSWSSGCISCCSIFLFVNAQFVCTFPNKHWPLLCWYCSEWFWLCDQFTSCAHHPVNFKLKIFKATTLGCQV